MFSKLSTRWCHQVAWQNGASYRLIFVNLGCQSVGVFRLLKMSVLEDEFGLLKMSVLEDVFGLLKMSVLEDVFGLLKMLVQEGVFGLVNMSV